METERLLDSGLNLKSYKTNKISNEEKEDSDNIERFTIRRSKTYAFLFFAATFINYCNLSIIAPFYPISASEKGLSEMTIGLVFASYSFSTFTFSLAIGKLIRKFGAKKMLVLGYSLAGLANITFGLLVYIDNVYVFGAFSFAIRIMEGFGVCAAENAILVMLSLMYPDNGNYWRGLFEMITGIGYSMGPVLGGFLYQIGGFGIPFYTTGTLTLINIILINQVVEYHHVQTQQSNGSILKIFLLPNTIICTLIGLVGFISLSIYTPVLEIHLKKFDLTPVELGMFFFAEAIFYGLTCPICGWITDKLKKAKQIMLLGLLTSAISALFLGPSSFVQFLEDSIQLNLLSLIGNGISIAIISVTTYQGILDGVFENGIEDNESTHSIVASIVILYYSLGCAVGPAIGGAILENFDFGTISSVVVVYSLIMFLVSTIFYIKQDVIRCR